MSGFDIFTRQDIFKHVEGGSICNEIHIKNDLNNNGRVYRKFFHSERVRWLENEEDGGEHSYNVEYILM